MEDTTIRCYQCHKLFKGVKKTRKYCSNECRINHSKSKVRVGNCKHCNKEFNTHKRLDGNGKARFQLFCSRDCHKEFHKDIRGSCLCVTCGKEFLIPSGASSNKWLDGDERRQFCGKFCFSMYYSLNTTLTDPNLPMHNLRYKYKGFIKSGYKCEDCGFDEVPHILTVHHIKGKRNGNGWGNLKVLCPNCHYLSHHKGGPTWQKMFKAVHKMRNLYKDNEHFRKLFNERTGIKLEGLE